MPNDDYNINDVVNKNNIEELNANYLKLIETDDVFKINFVPGQYIIVNNDNSGNVYFDPTNGTSLDDRIHLNPKQEIDIYIKEDNKSFEYYLDLHSKPKDGDLVIIKEPIVDSISNEENGKYVNHVFIYNNNEEDTNESDWCELLDSYKSSNVYMDQDLLLTSNIPENIEIDPNINEVLEMMFSQEKIPVIERPTLSVELLTKGKYLLGSSVSINFRAVFTKGNYEFGPDTGINITSSNVSSNLYENNSLIANCNNINVVEENNNYIITGSFSDITLNDLSKTYKVKVKVEYSQGSIPKTAKGENYLDGRISSSSVTKYSNSSDSSGIISSYIDGLYIGVSENELTENDININYLKTLTGTGDNYPSSTKNVNYQVPIGTKSIILACPSDSNGITEIYNSTANCYMDEAFGDTYQLTYSINGTEYGYDYWIYTPADAYINRTNLVITIG